jgi:hypothetical protein
MDSSSSSSSFDSSSQSTSQKQVKITDVAITDENMALNVLVGFLEMAHKKGAFTFEESAKIWECITKFRPAASK